MESYRRTTSIMLTNNKPNRNYRFKYTRKLLSKKSAFIWNISTYAKERARPEASSKRCGFSFQKSARAHSRNAHFASWLDCPSLLWLRLEEANLPSDDVNGRCFPHSMPKSHTNLRVSKSGHNLPPHGGQNRRDIPTSHQEFCRIHQWQRLHRRHDPRRIWNFCSPRLELWTISNTISLDHLVHEALGRVRWRFTVLPDAAIFTEVPRGAQREPQEIPHVFELRWYDSYKRREQAVQLTRAGGLCDVSHHWRTRYHVRLSNGVSRDVPSLLGAVPDIES